MKFKFIIITLLFVSSCSDKPSDKYSIKTFTLDNASFNNKLSGIRWSVTDFIFPRRIVNLDQYLIVSEHRKFADTLLYVFDKKSKELIRKIGPKGRGPGEIGNCWALYPSFKNKETFWVYELELKKINMFDLSSSNIHASEVINFSGDMRKGASFVFASDTSYMAVLAEGNKKFMEFNTSQKQIRSFDNWDRMLRQSVSPEIISALHEGVFRSDGEMSNFILACLNLDRIEILNKQSGEVISLRGPINHMPKFHVDHSAGYPMLLLDEETNLYCYSSIFCGEEMFYALFSGATSFEVNSNRRYCNDIFAFDYHGNLKRHYQLDISISDFSVDEVGEKIYGLTFGENVDIVEFNMPKRP